MTDDKDNRPPPTPSWLSERPYGGALPPAEPDPNKLPALPYLERHPEHRPRRQSWRRSIRRRLSEI
jgi:hypothetical protein